MKKLLYVLIFICALFITTNVNAEALPCTWEKDFAGKTGITLLSFDQNSDKYDVEIGSKVPVTFEVREKLDSDAEYRVFFKSTTDDNDRIYASLKSVQLVGHGPSKLVYNGHFIVPSNAKVGSEYEYISFAILVKDPTSKREYTTPAGTKVTSYDLFCGRYVFSEEELEYHQVWNASLLKDSFKWHNKKIKILPKNETDKEDKKTNTIFNSITLNNKSATQGGKVTYNLSLKQQVSKIYIHYHNYDIPSPFDGEFFIELNLDGQKINSEFEAVGQVDNNYYPLKLGDYYSETIQVWDKNGNFYIYTNNKNTVENNVDGFMPYVYYPYSVDLKIVEKQNNTTNTNNFKLGKLLLKNNNVKIGTNVPIEFSYSDSITNRTIKSVLLNYSSNNNNTTFSSYLKSLDKDSYFIIPSFVKEGTYKLNSVVVSFNTSSDETETIVLKNDEEENYNDIFSQELTVTKNDNADILYFSSEDLNDSIYNMIDNSKNNSIIVVDANHQTTIPYNLFESIKDTSRQVIINYKDNEWIINGIDVDNPKSIDVTMNFYDLNLSDLSNHLKTNIDDSSFVLEFSGNGNLPGTTLMRIKDEDVFSILKSKQYYIYYVDENNNKLNKVAMEVQKSYDGYIEFYINHNSKYVISSKEVTNKDVLGEDDEVLTNNTNLEKKNESSNNKTNDILFYSVIGIGIVIIILLIVIIIKLSKKVSNKTSNSVNKEVENNKE